MVYVIFTSFTQIRECRDLQRDGLILQQSCGQSLCGAKTQGRREGRAVCEDGRWPEVC